MNAPTDNSAKAVEVVAIELIACDGQKVMVPLHRLAQAYADLQRAPIANTVARIQGAVCLHYGVARSDLRGERRSAHLVLARHVAIYLARTLTIYSLPQIARQFGDRDHTSVLYACRKVESLIETDAAMKADIDLLTAVITDGEQQP